MTGMDACTVTYPLPDHQERRLEIWMRPMQLHLLQDVGLERVSRVTWSIDPSIHDTPRHFASTSYDGLNVAVAPEFFGLALPTQKAILRHEWGHVVDFLYPARLGRLSPEGSALRQPSMADISRWQERDPDHIESDADELAFGIFGEKISYQGWCQIQVVGEGIARPRGLR